MQTIVATYYSIAVPISQIETRAISQLERRFTGRGVVCRRCSALCALRHDPLRHYSMTTQLNRVFKIFIFGPWMATFLVEL